MLHEVETTEHNGTYYHRCVRCGAKKTASRPRWIGECYGRKLLGDIISGWLSRLGLHKRPGCGCDRRKSWLNRMTVILFRRNS